MNDVVERIKESRKSKLRLSVIVLIVVAVIVAAVAFVSAADQLRTQTQDKLQDGSCDTCDCETVCPVCGECECECVCLYPMV